MLSYLRYSSGFKIFFFSFLPTYFWFYHPASLSILSFCYIMLFLYRHFSFFGSFSAFTNFFILFLATLFLQMSSFSSASLFSLTIFFFTVITTMTVCPYCIPSWLFPILIFYTFQHYLYSSLHSAYGVSQTIINS